MSTAANPRAPKPDPENAPQEPTGAVAADSLAAESNRAGGAFSENENIAQLAVKGGQSTLANTDTSGATALHPASSGAARERQDLKGLGSDERGHTGVKYPDADVPDFGGVHSQEGYVGGTGDEPGRVTASTGASAAQSHSGATGDSFADGGAGLASSSSGQTSGISSGTRATQGGSSSTTSQGVSSSTGSSQGPAKGAGAVPVGAAGDVDTAETAPTYAATVAGTIRSEGELQPKGENLTEGDIPYTKTFTGNVGGDKDPGRLAEQKFEKINADTAGAAGQSSGESQGNPYDVLSSERA